MINYSYQIRKSLSKIHDYIHWDTLPVRSATFTTAISESKILDRAFCFLCMNTNVDAIKPK